MISEPFILLIFNCKKYRYKALCQKNTWLKCFEHIMPYFHVLGDEHMDDNYRFDMSNCILYVKTKDDYNSLPNKVIMAYYAIAREYNYKYIFKTDDDQNVSNISFFNTMIGLLSNESRDKIHYAGNIVNVTTPYMSQYYRIHPELPVDLKIRAIKYCSGRFYVLSCEAVNALLKCKEFIEKEYLEDYAVGLYLDKNMKPNMLHIQTDKYFTDVK